MQRKKKLSGQRKREELEREVCSTSFLETNKSSDSCTTSLATDTPNEHFTILYIHNIHIIGVPEDKLGVPISLASSKPGKFGNHRVMGSPPWSMLV